MRILVRRLSANARLPSGFPGSDMAEKRCCPGEKAYVGADKENDKPDYAEKDDDDQSGFRIASGTCGRDRGIWRSRESDNAISDKGVQERHGSVGDDLAGGKNGKNVAAGTVHGLLIHSTLRRIESVYILW